MDIMSDSPFAPQKKPKPIIQSLVSAGRQSLVIDPDTTVEGAFDSALQGITNICQPTVQGTTNSLAATLKQTQYQARCHHFVYSGKYAIYPYPSVTVTPASRVPVSGPPSDMTDVMEAYIMANVAEVHETDAFVGHIVLISPLRMRFQAMFWVHGEYVHIDDVAQVHLKVLLLDLTEETPKVFGVCPNVSYDTEFDYVQKAFP
ncbi:uncharacterized protein ATNIH1004_009626 [Aspergillus tanneri]|uniref:Uncharacterized protein n=1 Tax=Aspergillus tanneri TaxID=1220188 RepID=A0A5M9M7Z4_9EURO|nr:uncharacterized protein ATNIH1004_009626 [Aspergillus tanneri]KAA8642871.1 hypothetical protein ATNIH1004_009626 [Aspergillus tanneri]